MSQPQHNLHDCVRASLEVYFQDLDGTEPTGLHEMLVKAVEKPLLELVMQQSQNNQSRAAQWLGRHRFNEPHPIPFHARPPIRLRQNRHC